MNTNNIIIQQFVDHQHNLVHICFTLKLPEGIKVEFSEPVPAKYSDYAIAEFKKLYNL